jgi:hypothetical protein
MEHEPSPEEALVDAEVEALATAFAFLVPPDMLEQLKEDVRLFALTHPGVEPMVERLLPPPGVDASGTVSRTPGTGKKAAGGEGA